MRGIAEPQTAEWGRNEAKEKLASSARGVGSAAPKRRLSNGNGAVVLGRVDDSRRCQIPRF
jgi:hypothetical protein